VFGADRITSEIEIFVMITTFFQRIGLTSGDVALRVSNRQILQKVLNGMSVPDELFERGCVIIDKIAKKTREEMTDLLKTEIKLTTDQINTIYELCAVTDVSQLSNYLDANDETFMEMQKIFDLADKVGIRDWLQFDASIVRGLSYYTGIVFEGFARNLPALAKSLCGGGRYDNLLTTYGFKDQVPAIGFGFGDVTIIELLKDLNKMPVCSVSTKYLVVPFNSGFFAEAVQVSQQMRIKGICVETYTKNTRIKNAYDYADRKGIDNVILIAPDEWSRQEIVVKNLRADKDSPLKQVTMPLTDFLSKL
jgi:histidyl-tRNA synthetase